MKEHKRKIQLNYKFFVMLILVFGLFTGARIILGTVELAFAADETTEFDLKTILPRGMELKLTDEEKEYIRTRPIVKAVSIHGGAPIQYENKEGKISGISVSVLKRISQMTGLNFEYRLYDSGAAAVSSDADIFFGIPYNYAPQGMALSNPFLRSETILFINSSLQQHNLENLRYAAMKGSALPKGVNEKKAIYFNTREETLNAVNNGRADYGFGNAYSVAYYTLMHSYKNIVTVPRGKEARAYCFGLMNSDVTLLSIINKAIASISPEELQTLVLSIASDVDRDLTPAMVMHEYGMKVSLVIALVIAILLYSLFSNIRTNKMLSLQNIRYEVLSNISNEFIYEYDVKGGILQLSDKSKQIFNNDKILNEATGRLKNLLAEHDYEISDGIIRIPLGSGRVGVFKTINTNIYDDQGKRDSVIGKLIDISEETAEKEELLAKAQVDGLTDLYNAATARELIVDILENRNNKETDAFLIIDIDNFKTINDTCGHLAGDQILKHIGKRLKQTFRKSDIVGRIGGDEFCVYVKDISDPAFILENCEQLTILVQKEIENVDVSLSIGITPVQEKESYDDLFKKADAALYKAKENGKAQFVIYSND